MLHLLQTRVWALESKYYHHAVAVIGRRIDQGLTPLDASQMSAEAREREVKPRMFMVSAGGGSSASAERQVAVVSLIGAMQKRDAYCGPKGTASLGALIRQLDNDPKISAIVMEVDSPGGDVDGTEALGNIIKGTSKPIVGWVNGMAASAGYWAVSQTDHIMMSSKSSAYVGSIGVLALHVDQSAWLEKEGLNATIVRSTKATDKARINSLEPLTEELFAELTGELDKIHDSFITTVKNGRAGKAKAALADGLFTGKMFNGADAIRNGLADSIGTLDDAVRRASYLASRNGKATNQQSQQNQSNMKFTKVAALLGFSADASTDAEVQEVNMQQAENSITALEGERDTLQARVTELEGLSTTQAARITELEGLNATQAEQITTLTTANETLTTENTTLSEQNTQLEQWRTNNQAVLAPEGDTLNQDGQQAYVSPNTEAAAAYLADIKAARQSRANLKNSRS